MNLFCLNSLQFGRYTALSHFLLKIIQLPLALQITAHCFFVGVVTCPSFCIDLSQPCCKEAQSVMLPPLGITFETVCGGVLVLLLLLSHYRIVLQMLVGTCGFY